MASELRVGDRVRVTEGMYAGAAGVVVEAVDLDDYAVVEIDGERVECPPDARFGA